MQLAIIGTGYVGLTTGVCLADLGHTVTCVDHTPAKVDLLNQGKSPIFEPGIEELIEKNLNAKRLSFTTDLKAAIQNAEVVFICVNTPPLEDGRADLRYVERVARQLAEVLDQRYRVIVDKSTVPVKTAEKVKETIVKYANGNVDVDVVSNPEFLREGSAVADTLNPDRIVIGVDSDRAQAVMLELYQPLVAKTQCPIKIVSVRSAELIKHGANSFLATKISFANLIAETCEQIGADAAQVLEAIGIDKRIGKDFLKPGIGFGGSCFPKDTAAYKKTLEILGIDNDLIAAVEKINQHAWQRFVQRVERELWVLDGKVIAVLGLAFKPDTDDIRNAPALKIISKLQADGAKIKAYDPQAMKKVASAMPQLELATSPYEAVKGAEALLICTDWDEFKNLNLDQVKSQMATPIIFDGRNIFNQADVERRGFRYFGVGR